MALKRRIKKEDYDELSDTLKEQYLEKDGNYVLDIEGSEDTAKMKRAKDREVERRKEAETARLDAENRLAEIQGDDARKRGDIDTLEKSWKSKTEKIENDYKLKLSQRDEFVKKTLVDNKALEIANKFTKPSLFIPIITKRLSADLDGESPKTMVLDETGNKSALTISELTEEFLANPEYSDMIVASKASGSGASTKNKTPTQSGAFVGKKDWSSASAKEFTEHLMAKESQQE